MQKAIYWGIMLPKNWFSNTGNGIIQTGKEIISPTSGPLIKKLFYKMFLIFTEEFKIDYSKRKWKYFTYRVSQNTGNNKDDIISTILNWFLPKKFPRFFSNVYSMKSKWSTKFLLWILTEIFQQIGQYFNLKMYEY